MIHLKCQDVFVVVVFLKMKKKMYFKMSSAAAVISALKVKNMKIITIFLLSQLPLEKDRPLF